MTNDSNKRAVTITNAKTGEVRMSQPVAVHSLAKGVNTPSEEQATSKVQDAVPSVLSDVPSSPVETSPSPSDSPSQDGLTRTESAAALPNSDVENSFKSGESPKGPSAKKQPKADIETLEQFIEDAYDRKGKRVTLKPKVEKQIAQNPRLDDAALSRLLKVAKGDTLLVVPRQLLLLSREIDGFPSLKAAITSFVQDVMLRHPVFQEHGVKATLRNLPESIPSVDAIRRVHTFKPAGDSEGEPLKGAELQALQHNAAQLFVTWLGVNRGLNSEELSLLLFQAIWQPAERELTDDNARLRALTSIQNTAGVGLACQKFRQQAIDANAEQDLAQRMSTGLRAQLVQSETQRAQLEEQRDALQLELRALRESSAEELEALRRQHAVEKTHLQHELAQLRGRLVKGLTSSVDMLEVGLSALRKDTPSVRVMVERAEDVVDALRAEIQELKE